MRSRTVAAAGLLLALAAIASAENTRVRTRAFPPDKASLDRLNLRTEWTLYLPVEGGRDRIELVQTFDDQLFVQTRNGLLTAVDARAGKVLWSVMLGNGGYANVYPVAVNSRFVFVSHVTRLFAFYRYTGVLEFTTDLRTPPTAGLAADDTGVYATLASRPGAAGVERIAAYDLPRPIAIADVAKAAEAKDVKMADKDKLVNPVDELTTRYPVAGVSRIKPPPTIEPTGRIASLREVPSGGLAGSRTPSLAVVTRVTPPYFREGDVPAPSLAIIPSLRRPYHLRDENFKDIQRTPSIASIPPSVAAALALSDLRPRGIEPRLRWEYGMTVGVSFRPTLSPLRVWVVTNDRGFVSLSKANKTTEVAGKTSELVAAPPAQAGTTGYVPLGDGGLVAVDLTAGSTEGGLNTYWRTNVGGLMNRTPVVTEDAVFAAGDNSGVVRVDRASGAIVWRSDRPDDRVVAVNQDFAYIQNRQGRLLVYDVRRPTGPVPGQSVPLSGMDMSEFTVPITNTVSDRLYFAADNGLLVCLRDASPKYAAPVRMAPDIIVNPVAKERVEGLKEGMPPMPGEALPKKDEVPPKKEEAPPKKD